MGNMMMMMMMELQRDYYCYALLGVERQASNLCTVLCTAIDPTDPPAGVRYVAVCGPG
jgi:hypothetical protein